MSDFVLLGGERFLRLEIVARWYHVDVAYLEEAIEFELLECDLEPAGESREVALPEHELDRLAELLRLHWQTGLDLEALALLLPPRARRRR